MELELGEERAEALLVRAAVAELVEVELDGHVLVEGDELLREVGLVLPLRQVPLERLLRDVVEVRVEVVQVLVVRQQLRGGLGPHRLDPRHVVGAVADQREIVPQPLGRHAHLLDGLLAPEDLVAHGIEHDDTVLHQLEQVLVRADDDHAQPRVTGPTDHGRDEVIGLVGVVDETRNRVGLDDVLEPVDLLAQVLGRRRAGGLVLRVELLPERGPGRVEGHREARGPLLVDEREQHLGDPVHGVRGLAGGRAHGRQGVIGAEDVAGQVDDPEHVGVAGGGKRGGHGASRIEPTAGAHTRNQGRIAICAVLHALRGAC